MSQSVQCKACGAALNCEARFCGQCGTPAKEGEASAASNNQNLAAPVGMDSRSRKAMAETMYITTEIWHSTLARFLDRHGISRELICVLNRYTPDRNEPRVYLEKLLETRKINYVIITGGWDDVPPFEYDNPAIDIDNEQLCFSDAPYGLPASEVLYDANNAIPGIPVGRIPVVEESILDNVMLGQGEPIFQDHALDSVVTAQCWETPTRKILETLGLKANISWTPDEEEGSEHLSMLSSPEWDIPGLKNRMDGRGIRSGSMLLFNVHGSADRPIWVGEGGQYVPIHQPGTINNYNRSILISEACYGGALGYTTDSIVEDFFRRGGVGFVGCSVVAYGAIDEQITAADVLALTFAQSMLEGESMGKALEKAKQSALQEGVDVPEMSAKTIVSFNLYGAPWRRLPVTRTGAVEDGRLIEHSKRRDMLRERLSMPATGAPGVLDKYRKSYKRRLSDAYRRRVLSSSDAQTAMARFKDRTRIEVMLDKWRKRYSKLEISVPAQPSDMDYRIVCSGGEEGINLERRVIVLDRHGTIKRLVTTKGGQK